VGDCFANDSRHRRSGIGAALLEAAFPIARLRGATSLEGHPVDTAAWKVERVSGSALFTATMNMFVNAGLSKVALTVPTRPVMRHAM
jgi:GNAT superfamily N-acetyltransferase